MKMEFLPYDNGVSYRGKWNFPGRNGEIHRNFDFILPKFHFILPNFYFPVPWGIFVSS